MITRVRTFVKILILFLVVSILLMPSFPRSNILKNDLFGLENRTNIGQNNTTYGICVGPIWCYTYWRFGSEFIEDKPHITIIATIPNGTIYTTNTNGDFSGWFWNMPWPSFPLGTNFTATRDGFKDIYWKQGEEIPDMYMKEDEPQYICCTSCLIMIPIVFIVIFIIVAIIFIIGSITYKLNKQKSHSNKRDKKRNEIRKTKTRRT